MMMIARCLFFEIFIICYFLSSFAVLAKDENATRNLPTVEVVYAHFPPYSYEDDAGKPSGIAVQKVQQFFSDKGVSYVLRMMPWSRGVKTLETNPNTMMFMYDRMPEREDKFLWVLPLLKAQLWIVGRRDFEAPTISIEAFNRVGMKAACYQNSSGCLVLAKMGFGPAQLVQFPNNQNNHLTILVERGRVDFLLKEEKVLEWEAEQAGAMYPLKKILAVDQNAYPYESYLVANKNLEARLKRLLIKP